MTQPSTDLNSGASGVGDSPDDGGRLKKPSGRTPVFVERETIRKIKRYGSVNSEIEVCGVLLGNLCWHPDNRWYLVVDDIIIGKDALHNEGSVTFTEQTWNYINAEHDKNYPHKIVVGWFHTHPGFGIFFSEDDLLVHQMGFTFEWEVAYVYDPLREDDGWFLWDEKKREPVRSDEVQIVDTRKASPDEPKVFKATARLPEFSESDAANPVVFPNAVAFPAEEDKGEEMVKNVIFGGVAFILFTLICIIGLFSILKYSDLNGGLTDLTKRVDTVETNLDRKVDIDVYFNDREKSGGSSDNASKSNKESKAESREESKEKSKEEPKEEPKEESKEEPKEESKEKSLSVGEDNPAAGKVNQNLENRVQDVEKQVKDVDDRLKKVEKVEVVLRGIAVNEAKEANQAETGANEGSEGDDEGDDEGEPSE